MVNKPNKPKQRDKYSYGWEKLYKAVSCLIGAGDLKIRLQSAMECLCPLKEDEYPIHIPNEILNDFSKFMKDMTCVKPSAGEDGTISATLNSLDEAGLEHAAKQILSFYDAVCRHRRPSKSR
jgi:hypothetical protein